MTKDVSQKEFAEFIGYSERMVTDFVNKEGMPVKRRGKSGHATIIDSAAAVKWLIDRAVDKKLGNTQRTRDNETAINRLKHWQAQKAELEAKQLSGELASVDELRQILTHGWLILARRLDAIASECARKLAPAMKPADIRHELLTRIRKARMALADEFSSLKFVPPDSASPPPAAEKKQRRMGKAGKNPARRRRHTGAV